MDNFSVFQDIILARINGEIEKLIAHASCKDEKIRAFALLALSNTSALNRDFLKQFQNDKSLLVKRMLALILINRCELKVSTELVKEFIVSDDFVLCCYGCVIAGDRKIKELVNVLADLVINNPNNLVKEYAIAALGEIGEVSSLELIKKFSHSQSGNIKKRTLIALSNFDDASATEIIKLAQNDTNFYVRQVAKYLMDN